MFSNMYWSTLKYYVLEFRKDGTGSSLCSPICTGVHFNIMYLSLERMVLEVASVLQYVLEYTLILCT